MSPFEVAIDQLRIEQQKNRRRAKATAYMRAWRASRKAAKGGKRKETK